MLNELAVKEAMRGYRIIIIPGGFLEDRIAAVYGIENYDYVVPAMRNSALAKRMLSELGISERKILTPPESYFPYSSSLGDLWGTKQYLIDECLFERIGPTGITTQWWCAPRFLITAWRIGYSEPYWIKADDSRPWGLRKFLDIFEEWLTDMPAYLLAMFSPETYLEKVEPKLQKLREVVYNKTKKLRKWTF